MSPAFMHDFQHTLLQLPVLSILLLLRDYHPLWQTIPGHFLFNTGHKNRTKHHISHTLLHGIQFALHCFQSPLLTASQLISFPAVTKTFQFTALAILTDLLEKSHSEIFGSKRTYRSPKHIVVSHVLLRQFKPSHPPDNVNFFINLKSMKMFSKLLKLY